MKNKLIRTTATMVFLCIIGVSFLLSGCTPAIKTKNEILKNLESHPMYVDYYDDYEISSLEITKRMTDKKNKKDIVYVSLNVINKSKSVQGKIDYIIEYILYNDGWILENVKKNEDNTNNPYFTPLSIPEINIQQIAKDIASVNGGDVWTDLSIYKHQTNLDKGANVYYLIGTEKHNYVTYTNDAILTYTFSNDYGKWGLPSLTINSCNEEWNIEGNYLHKEYEVTEFISGEISKGEITIQDVRYNNPTILNVYKTSDLSFDELAKKICHKRLLGPDVYEYVTDYNFNLVLLGGYSYQYYKYVAFSGYTALLIGEDAISYYEDDDADEFNRRVWLKFDEMTPIK